MKKVAAFLTDDADRDRIAKATAPALLHWYDRHRRDLPWRSAPGVASDPYRVWLSEIMLQQTTVAAVKPYFAAFLSTWPNVEALARAPLDNVLKAWAGLGYYARARNLHACAQTIVAEWNGRFPAEEERLRELPGIGRYTAAAIAAIAFDRRAVVVDGNVERVMARLFSIETQLPQAKPLLHAAMETVTPPVRVGDFAQAMMDIGATICTPRTPACSLCPLTLSCQARRSGLELVLPRKAAKKATPRRGGAVLVIVRHDGAVLVRRRPSHGLFGGMIEFPSTTWAEGFAETTPPEWPADLQQMSHQTVRIGAVDHGLTHFNLKLQVYLARADFDPTDGALRWVEANALDAEAFPTLMRKILGLSRRALAREMSESPGISGARAPDSPGLFDSLGVTPRRPPSPGWGLSRTHRMPRSGIRRRLQSE